MLIKTENKTSNNEIDDENKYRALKVENEELKRKIHILSICDKCGKRFEDPGNMREHILSNHRTENLKCNECSENF